MKCKYLVIGVKPRMIGLSQTFVSVPLKIEPGEFISRLSQTNLARPTLLTVCPRTGDPGTAIPYLECRLAVVVMLS